MSVLCKGVDNGSWIWRIGAGADQVLTEAFTIEGADTVQASTGREDGRPHLELFASEEIVFIYTGGDLEAIDGRDLNCKSQFIHEKTGKAGAFPAIKTKQAAHYVHV